MGRTLYVVEEVSEGNMEEEEKIGEVSIVVVTKLEQLSSSVLGLR